jgi:Carboxypeptidase regulatory-like domain
MNCERALHDKDQLKALDAKLTCIGVQVLILLFFIPVFVLTAEAQESPVNPASQSTATLATGVIQGKVLDESGATLSGAGVTLTGLRTGVAYSTRTDSVGDYSFTGLQADEFKITASAHGFDSFTIADIALASGQNLDLAPIVMHVAAVSSKVEVTASQREVAEAQMKSEQKQRILGVLPNYYVAYFHDPVPLSAGQKMRLAFRLAIDPVTVGIDAAQAGLQTNDKNFKEYGTGAEGFAKRFAAAYAEDASGTMIGSGLLPALLHQDPRYYYKGTGSTASRALYALSWTFRCKGDNGNWQVNYSSIIGNVATTALSDLYYPKAIRDDGVQTLKYSLLSMASQGVSALLQEFVFKRVTSHANDPGKEASSDSTVGGSSHLKQGAPTDKSDLR